MNFLHVFIILQNMGKIIIWIWIFSAIGLMYKGYCFVFDKITNYFNMAVSKHLSNMEMKAVKTKFEECVNKLSAPEQQVMKLVSGGNGCGVWVAKNDSAVLTLLYKGMLRQISNEERFHEWEFSEGYLDSKDEICILVVVNNYLAKN